MDPIKPTSSSEIFVGERGQKLLAFLPENSPYRTVVLHDQPIPCENHVLALDGRQNILPGRGIIAVKRATGGHKGQPTYNVKFYCSVECQRNHAVKLKSRQK